MSAHHNVSIIKETMRLSGSARQLVACLPVLGLAVGCKESKWSSDLIVSFDLTSIPDFHSDRFAGELTTTSVEMGDIPTKGSNTLPVLIHLSYLLYFG